MCKPATLYPQPIIRNLQPRSPSLDSTSAAPCTPAPQDWRFKLDNQVKSYRSELGDLRKTLNSEVSQLRGEFQVRGGGESGRRAPGVGCRVHSVGCGM
jgi:hypothetical protein